MSADVCMRALQELLPNCNKVQLVRIMSLSNFTKLGKRQEEGDSHVSTRHSHRSDNPGRIMMQGQSSKTVKGPALKGKASNNPCLVNIPHFSQYIPIPMANNVKPTPDPLPPKQSEKAPEPAMATYSACSRFDGASNDHAFKLKRKSPKTGDSDSFSDKFEEESIAFKKANCGRKGSKRCRPSEVNNSSKREQKERINEKMRALQEFLPNCNKVEEVSILNNAIEYMKALKLQTHLISMGAGMFMPPMMFPTTIQPMHIPHVPQFLPMGVGIPPLVPSATTSRQVAENVGSQAIPNDRSSNTTSREAYRIFTGAFVGSSSAPSVPLQSTCYR